MSLSRAMTLPFRMLWHALFWTFERATWQYDLMVIAILAFHLADAAGVARRPHGRRTGTDRHRPGLAEIAPLQLAEAASGAHLRGGKRHAPPPGHTKSR